MVNFINSCRSRFSKQTFACTKATKRLNCMSKTQETKPYLRTIHTRIWELIEGNDRKVDLSFTVIFWIARFLFICRGNFRLIIIDHHRSSSNQSKGFNWVKVRVTYLFVNIGVRVLSFPKKRDLLPNQTRLLCRRSIFCGNSSVRSSRLKLKYEIISSCKSR